MSDGSVRIASWTRRNWIVKKFHVVVFRGAGFLAVAWCWAKPAKMAHLYPFDPGDIFSSENDNGVTFFCYSGLPAAL
jgi:hypothetical protein